MAFEVLIKQQIIRLQSPSLICVKRVYDELRTIIYQIEIPEIFRYRKLDSKIRSIMEDVLNKCLDPTNQMIKNLINIESSYINTSHPDFLGPEESMLNLFEEREVINHQNHQIKNFPLNSSAMNTNISINNEIKRNNNNNINSNKIKPNIKRKDPKQNG